MYLLLFTCLYISVVMPMLKKIASQMLWQGEATVWLHYSDLCKCPHRPHPAHIPKQPAVFTQSRHALYSVLIWIDFLKLKHWDKTAQERKYKQIQATPTDTATFKVQLKSHHLYSFLKKKTKLCNLPLTVHSGVQLWTFYSCGQPVKLLRAVLAEGYCCFTVK